MVGVGIRLSGVRTSHVVGVGMGLSGFTSWGWDGDGSIGGTSHVVGLLSSLPPGANTHPLQHQLHQLPKTHG